LAETAGSLEICSSNNACRNISVPKSKAQKESKKPNLLVLKVRDEKYQDQACWEDRGVLEGTQCSMIGANESE
jgi:hypothetical protein